MRSPPGTSTLVSVASGAPPHGAMRFGPSSTRRRRTSTQDRPARRGRLLRGPPFARMPADLRSDCGPLRSHDRAQGSPNLPNDFVKGDNLMGGFGSGRPGRVKAESCRTLDVNLLHREGCLGPGAISTCEWNHNGAPAGDAELRAGGGFLHLSYWVRKSVIATGRTSRTPSRSFAHPAGMAEVGPIFSVQVADAVWPSSTSGPAISAVAAVISSLTRARARTKGSERCGGRGRFARGLVVSPKSRASSSSGRKGCTKRPSSGSFNSPMTTKLLPKKRCSLHRAGPRRGKDQPTDRDHSRPSDCLSTSSTVSLGPNSGRNSR